MISKIQNTNVNFTARNRCSMDKWASYDRARELNTPFDYEKYKKQNKYSAKAKISAALAVLMLTGGGIAIKANRSENEIPNENKIVIQLEENEKLTPEAAIDEILNDEELKQVFCDLVETKKNMEKTVENPIKEIQEILKEEHGKNLEIELILPQIFVESSGNHYNEDGNVNSSWANCNGWLQLSEDATCDMNKLYFEGKEKNRNKPLDNLHLGIAFDNYLSDKFDGDKFKTLAAYNCGAGNVLNGKNYGDAYAQKILNYYEILKNNPQYTEILLSGGFDEYQNELLS